MNLQVDHHPTTWVFVDDEARFLDALRALLPSDQPARLFERQRDAREYIDGHCAQALSEAPAASGIKSVAQRLTDTSRFARVSVVVCDYAMPEQDGIRFLSDLAPALMYKALLTGVADEEVALGAFNAGTIDRYLRKADAEVLDDLLAYCRSSSLRLFQRKQQVHIPSEAFWQLANSAEFCNAFAAFLVDQEVVEHYFLDRPRGFVCVDAEGRVLFLSVRTQREADQGASAEWPASPAQPWARLIDGWQVGVAEAPLPGDTFDPQRHSFSAFLRES